MKLPFIKKKKSKKITRPSKKAGAKPATTSRYLQTEDLTREAEVYDYQPSEDTLREIQRAERKAKEEAEARRRKLLLRGAIIVGAAFLIIFIWNFIEARITYSSYKVISEGSAGSSGEMCELFEDGIILYSANGMKFTDTDGETKWDYGFKMTSPKILFTGSYGMVYDLGYTDMVLFTSDGVETAFASTSPISTVGLSEHGVTALLTQVGTTGSVFFYDNTGRQLDIEVKNVLAENSGYPISMSLSPSGTGLVLSLTFVDQGSIKTRVSFLNFDVGKDSTDRVVGFFEYEDAIFPQVEYLDSDSVVAFGDKRLVFYSLSNEASPKLSEEIEFEEEISSAFTGDGLAAVITRANEGGYKLHLYDDDGSEIMDEAFDCEYSKVGISDGYVMIYGGENSIIATTSGHIKFEGSFDGVTTDMVSVGTNKFLQYGDYGVRTIKIK